MSSEYIDFIKKVLPELQKQLNEAIHNYITVIAKGVSIPVILVSRMSVLNANLQVMNFNLSINKALGAE